MKRIESVFFAIVFAASVFIVGCGGDEGPAVAIGSKSRPREAAQRVHVPDAEVARAVPQDVAPQAAPVRRASGFVPAPEESWPPEIVATVSDTVVAPGQVVQVRVRSTPDVTEIALWDGRGEKEPFYYDEAHKTWKTTYRAPLVSQWERIGLSITARNAEGRWRRVWTFVRLMDDESDRMGATKLAAGAEHSEGSKAPNAPVETTVEPSPEGSSDPDPDGS